MGAVVFSVKQALQLKLIAGAVLYYNFYLSNI